ncbi:MAG: hypothetical protein INQ03_21380 [Candidatus Heimdallarchaeota archaeon]|nr:hypothetical protein [Candidatus Heimdallarchaeota archaeon]
MIILDNSVLSAFTRLGLINSFELMFEEIIIPTSVKQEYSMRFHTEIPKFIEVIYSQRSLTEFPPQLTEADVDVVELGISKNMLIASDDLTLRKFARSQGLRVTGSLGILRKMYLSYQITNTEEYRKLLYQLSEDVYMTENLIQWALNTERE